LQVGCVFRKVKSKVRAYLWLVSLKACYHTTLGSNERRPNSKLNYAELLLHNNSGSPFAGTNREKTKSATRQSMTKYGDSCLNWKTTKMKDYKHALQNRPGYAKILLHLSLKKRAVVQFIFRPRERSNILWRLGRGLHKPSEYRHMIFERSPTYTVIHSSYFGQTLWEPSTNLYILIEKHSQLTRFYYRLVLDLSYISK